MTTYHDIEADGKRYIMEWIHGEPLKDEMGYIMLTEACDAPDDEFAEHDHETYDFQGVQ